MPLLPPTSPRPRPAPWPRAAPWLLLGYTTVGLGLLALGPVARSLGLNLLNTVLFSHAGFLALARSRTEPAATWGWRGLALGLLAQAGNQAWASLYMLRLETPPPFPSWGDLLSLLSLALIISALLAWPLASASGSERLRKGLDGLGAALAALMVGWYFALGPLFKASAATPREHLALVLFFLGNATILGICAYLGARDTSRFRGPLGWVTLGFGVSVLQVTLQVPLTLVGAYHLGHPLDLLVLLAALFILLASLAPVALEPGPSPGTEVRDRSPRAQILPMLPATTALGFVSLTLLWAPQRLDGNLLTLALTMGFLGLVRGLLALRDLQQLSLELELRVVERTESLEQMQQAMIRTERMNAMAVLGAGLAHDLNNALATIRAYAELAQERLAAGHPTQAKDLDHILVAADQSATLTKRLMAFGRAEEQPPAAMCLREACLQLESILWMLLGRGISLQLDLGDQAVWILGTRAQIEQILVNLVANARDAMPNGGAISLRLSTEISAGRPLARIELMDTGEGMTPEVLASLFRPFFTTKGPGHGTGLGLASVHQIMKDLGGTLAVASQAGMGTTFVLRFPLVQA